MKRIVWATDIHLEFVTARAVDAFCQTIAAHAPDIVLLGGDTGIAPTFRSYLLRIEELLQRPIYFVLGNHDCYGGSIVGVRSTAEEITNNSRWLRWLSASGVVELTPDTGLIGHDGWADGRLGSSVDSQVMLNDFLLIDELRGQPQAELFAKLNTLGDESADYFREHLPAAAKRFRHLLLLTHVPPFKEACWHEGRISDDEFLPHFTCRAVGGVLIEVMQEHPDCNLVVLCGHTHGPGEAQILSNLLVKTGGAEYGQPCVQEMLSIH